MPELQLIRRGDEASVFYVMTSRDNIRDICKNLKRDITVASVSVENWNLQLSPWKAPKSFRDGEDFGGGAGEYLAALTEAIPSFEEASGFRPEKRVLCGYSLAGLCALYALYATDMFMGAVSASGSTWFDGWMDYIADRKPLRGDARAYLSVGDKEAKTRNMRFAAVEKNARSTCDAINSCGGHAVFELNEGNHFRDAELRLARGMDRLFGML